MNTRAICRKMVPQHLAHREGHSELSCWCSVGTSGRPTPLRHETQSYTVGLYCVIDRSGICPHHGACSHVVSSTWGDLLSKVSAHHRKTTGKRYLLIKWLVPLAINLIHAVIVRTHYGINGDVQCAKDVAVAVILCVCWGWGWAFGAKILKDACSVYALYTSGYTIKRRP